MEQGRVGPEAFAGRRAVAYPGRDVLEGVAEVERPPWPVIASAPSSGIPARSIAESSLKASAWVWALAPGVITRVKLLAMGTEYIV